MLPSQYLRNATRTALDVFKGSARDFEESKGLEKWALRGFIDPSREQIPSIDKAAKIAEAVGLEFYIGPPRFSDPAPIPTTVAELGPADVVAFETGAVKGSVLAEIEVPSGIAKLALTPEDARALADQLTHRAMQIEEKK